MTLSHGKKNFICSPEAELWTSASEQPVPRLVTGVVLRGVFTRFYVLKFMKQFSSDFGRKRCSLPKFLYAEGVEFHSPGLRGFASYPGLDEIADLNPVRVLQRSTVQPFQGRTANCRCDPGWRSRLRRSLTLGFGIQRLWRKGTDPF